MTNNSKWPRALTLAVVGMSMLFICGMGSLGGAPPPAVVVLLADTQGPYNRSQPVAEWIDSRKALERVFAELQALKFSAEGPKAAPEIDFAAHRALLVQMGRKPTAGYILQLNPGRSAISRQTAIIGLDWTEPASGQAVAQVVTSPFILLKVEKGGYTSVKVIDQHDNTLFDLPDSK